MSYLRATVPYKKRWNGNAFESTSAYVLCLENQKLCIIMCMKQDSQICLGNKKRRIDVM